MTEREADEQAAFARDLARDLGICERCGDDLEKDRCHRCVRCCPLATSMPCFCADARRCPVHGETHSGTHD